MSTRGPTARTAKDALDSYLGGLRNGSFGRALKALTYERRDKGADRPNSSGSGQTARGPLSFAS